MEGLDTRLSGLSDEELVQLRQLIDERLAAPGVDAGADGRPKGHIEAKMIPRGDKLCGPYLYLRYWENGHLKSKYLGKGEKLNTAMPEATAANITLAQDLP